MENPNLRSEIAKFLNQTRKHKIERLRRGVKAVNKHNLSSLFDSRYLATTSRQEILHRIHVSDQKVTSPSHYKENEGKPASDDTLV